MRRPSSLPLDWQPPSDLAVRRHAARLNQRSESTPRDNRATRWHVPVTNESESDAWWLSYLDLVSLLLVVFAVLWAVSKADLKATQAQVSQDEAPLVELADAPLPDPLPVTLVSSLRAKSDKILPEMNLPAYNRPVLPHAATLPTLAELDLDELGNDIDVIADDTSIRFRISSESLFTPGQADLLPAGEAVLARMVKVLERNDHLVAIEGHSDTVPIQNHRFPSNWELSAGRAASVLRNLVNHGIDPKRLRATGYAYTHPIAPNETADGRAANRRVELIMEIQRLQG